MSNLRHSGLLTLTSHLADDICNRIVNGQRMKDIGVAVGVSLPTILHWEAQNVRGFRDAMNEARRLSANTLQDECLQIADDCPLNSVAVARAGLQIKTRMAIIARLNPPRIEAPVTLLEDEDVNQATPLEYLRDWHSKNPPLPITGLVEAEKVTG